MTRKTACKKVRAFIKRDILIQMSYKLSFFLQFIGIFFSVLTFYFIAEMIGDAAVPYLEPYGGDYFSFVLIGIAFESYLWTGLRSFSDSIRRGQMMGTLEAMLVTPTKVDTIVVSSSLWDYLFATFRILIFLLLGVFLFGVNISDANLFAAMIILILTIICFSSLGIISASFIMVFKRGDPVNWVFGSMSALLGGVLYPITVLPAWLQIFSYLLPITYSLRGMRHALLQGYSLEALSLDILALIVFSVLLLPLGMICFRYAVKKAKMDGSLTQY
jgi:ABC-2 type transport system permease protein